MRTPALLRFEGDVAASVTDGVKTPLFGLASRVGGALVAQLAAREQTWRGEHATYRLKLA